MSAKNTCQRQLDPCWCLAVPRKSLDYSPAKSLEWRFQNSFTHFELDLMKQTTWLALLLKRSRPLTLSCLRSSLFQLENLCFQPHSSFPLNSEEEALHLLLEVNASAPASSLTAPLMNSLCPSAVRGSLPIDFLLLGFKYSQVSEILNKKP